jgi:LmbE family N-acetylglucosaminyl deacetylase
MRLPPGTTTEITARRVLVVAPHFDDEVLGCGGLLAQVAGSGGEARALFLTDGGGGVEAVADPEAYRRRRRQEAEAVVELLGLAGADYLDLPDGQLEHRLVELSQALQEALERHRPQLLLVPSPLEATGDHQAAFRALYDLLAPLRGSAEGLTGLGPQAADLEIFLYEVNHPFYPQVLVDVSPQLDLLARAMELYGSQQERHDYLAAGVGLRRYRTLSLGPEVQAAEGYVRLRLEDFTTRSFSQLVSWLGGAPPTIEVRQGPRLSVVVRTRNRPQLLAEALASLAASSYRPLEVVLVNDGGDQPSLPADFPLPVVSVNLKAQQGRAGAAEAGVQAAGGTYVSFLDDDDLVAPEHFATLASLVSSPGVRIAYTDAAVAVYQLEAGGWACAERRLPYSRDFDAALLRLDNYIPFNTLSIERQLLLEAGPFDPSLPFFEDWDMLIRLSRLAPFHHLAQVTCEYRHFRGGDHQIFGESPRQRQDFLEVKAKVLAKHGVTAEPELVARVVDTLRAEAVTQAEQLYRRREEISEQQRLVGRQEAAYFRLNGELESVQEDRERLRFAFEETRAAFQEKADQELELRRTVADQEAHLQTTYGEIQRLQGDVDRLTAEMGEHGEHLRRTYAEIERLGGIIRSMEETRAWRLHSWLSSRRRGSE